MFDSYEHLQDNYIPNNLDRCRPKPCKDSVLEPLTLKKPYEEYNAEGDLSGYWWYYGDVLNLEFNITGDIVVEDNAIIYTAIGEAPTDKTKGDVGQKAYNVKDLKSWTCTAYDSLTDLYSWIQDDEFENPEVGNRNIYVDASDFMSGKEVNITLYNFRHEPLVTKTFEGSTSIIFTIDKGLSTQMVKGVYYCRMVIYSGDDLNKTIFALPDEVTLTVK